MKTSEAIEEIKVEEIKKDAKVQRALNETSSSVQKESPVALKKEAPLLGITAIIFMACGALYYLLGWKRLPISSIYIPLAQKIVLAVMMISLVLTGNKAFEKSIQTQYRR
ncbi:MAG: hypothetical protein U5L72_01475 [Bacteroidales bacterium]|nr:hypothetical protein [Bacteroidales bacterium]